MPCAGCLTPPTASSPSGGGGKTLFAGALNMAHHSSQRARLASAIVAAVKLPGVGSSHASR
ncbi:hypothetical protein LTS18_013227, partial [Coniosporium uncinatum]